MIYRFVLVSDEVSDFLREIRIDGTASFLELHKAILDAAGYHDNELTSFFIADKQWRPSKEILLTDMGFKSTDEEYYLMDDTYLDQFIEDPGDRLLYQFDQLGDRYFYIELKEVILGEQLDQPTCTRRKGKAPKQTSDVEELLAATPQHKATIVAPSKDGESDDYYGDEALDLSDIDLEGFDISEKDL